MSHRVHRKQHTILKTEIHLFTISFLRPPGINMESVKIINEVAQSKNKQIKSTAGWPVIE